MALSKFELFTHFPQFADSTQVVTLGNRKYSVRFVWRERLNGWYIDLFDDTDTALFTNRRLSPDSIPSEGALDLNPGILYCFGDDSRRDNLGKSFFLAYIEP